MSQEAPPSSAPATARVSRWLGIEGEELTLSRARQALALSAREAGRPSFLWLSGIVYPALDLVPGGIGIFVSEGGAGASVRVAVGAQLGITFGLMLLVFPVRLMVGLAAISTPQGSRRVGGERVGGSLREAWRAGRGITLAGFGLALQMLIMACVGVALLVAPPYYFLKGLELAPESNLFIALLAPFIGVFLVYLALLSVMYQLALSSLGHNRRGAHSALLHAWRIARHRPWATTRAALVDLVLWVMQRAILFALIISCIGLVIVPFFAPALWGFVGVTRAGYWARIYRELGGLMPEDGVPGLGDAGAASAELPGAPHASAS